MIAPDVVAWLNNTQGLIRPEEGARLAELAAQVLAYEAIVEIGAHTGLSTCWLAAGAAAGRGAHVVCVDPWGPARQASDDPWKLGPEGVLQRFLANVAGTTQEVPRDDLGSSITPLRTTSEEAARLWVKPIGLLFVDAIHQEWAVRADYEAWAPHMAPDGVLAFHDYHSSYPGCVRAIDAIEAQGEWRQAGVVGSLWVGRRRV